MRRKKTESSPADSLVYTGETMFWFLLWLSPLAGCADPEVAPSSVSAPLEPATERSIRASRPPWLTDDLDRLAAELPPETDIAGQPGIVGAPAWSADGHRVVAARRLDDVLSTELVVADRAEDWRERVLVADGMPDRPAISADGRTVAYFASVDGLPALFTVPFDGSERPTQRTNQDLDRDKVLGAPEGWIPPPADDSLAFDDDHLIWDTPDGPQAVPWK